jgi:hypothetical protein
VCVHSPPPSPTEAFCDASRFNHTTDLLECFAISIDAPVRRAAPVRFVSIWQPSAEHVGRHFAARYTENTHMSDLLTRRVLVTQRDIVHAPPSVMWAIMMDEMRNPAKYIPRVTDVTIIRDGTTFVERKMTLDGEELHEIVSLDPNVLSLVHRVHASHPAFSGFVSCTVLPDPASTEEFGAVGHAEDRTCYVDFTMTLTAKASLPQDAFKAAREKFRDSLLQSSEMTKQCAERLGTPSRG